MRVSTRRRILSSALILGLAIPGLLQAESLVTVICDEPRGPRIDYFGNPKTDLQEERDGFTGVNPVFILDPAPPQTLTVLWGDVDLSHILPKELLRSPKAERHPIIHRTREQITAVDSYDKGVWLYSLFPDLGFGVFARHSHPGGQALGAMYYARCRWSR
jgi:hypothetical protein